MLLRLPGQGNRELIAISATSTGYGKLQFEFESTIRNTHPELQVSSNTLILNAWNDEILAYARIAKDRSSIIMVIANLDPNSRRECVYEVPLWEFGLSDFATIEAEDLLFGGRFYLHGKTHHIALDPACNPVIIWHLINPSFKTGQAS